MEKKAAEQQMSKPENSPSRHTVNRLLFRLPAASQSRLGSRVKRVPLILSEIIQEWRAPLEHVYFPLSGVISAITVSLDGDSIEVSTIGNEGMVGLSAFIGSDVAGHRMLVQVNGEALRMSVADLRAEASEDADFRRILTRYHAAFLHQISQAVLCNGLHNIKKRCCKWLLMTHDRVRGDEFALTHEFMSQMLGVRRAGVTEILNSLHKDRIIRNENRRVLVLDRDALESVACECYQAFREEFASW
jgi:CRP-like cAMP-binding protein